MEFVKGMVLKEDAIAIQGEILNNQYLSMSHKPISQLLPIIIIGFFSKLRSLISKVKVFNSIATRIHSFSVDGGIIKLLSLNTYALSLIYGILLVIPKRTFPAIASEYNYLPTSHCVFNYITTTSRFG